jgi:hypothetical protein
MEKQEKLAYSELDNKVGGQVDWGSVGQGALQGVAVSRAAMAAVGPGQALTALIPIIGPLSVALANVGTAVQGAIVGGTIGAIKSSKEDKENQTEKLAQALASGDVIDTGTGL